MEKSNERRNILLGIAKIGIKQHLTKRNYHILERKINNEIKKTKKQSSWKTEFYHDYLLKMEQHIFI